MSTINSSVRGTRRVFLAFLCASFLLAPAASLGAQLKVETVNAWDAYILKANLEMDDRLHGRFLWVDEVPERMQSVRAGNILVSSVGEHNPKPVPSGLIHDWMGAAFYSRRQT